jgi:hypothetical protein
MADSAPSHHLKTMVFQAYLEAEGKIASETAAKKRSAPFLLQCQTITILSFRLYDKTREFGRANRLVAGSSLISGLNLPFPNLPLKLPVTVIKSSR